jgi:hypothetical protein
MAGPGISNLPKAKKVSVPIFRVSPQPHERVRHAGTCAEPLDETRKLARELKLPLQAKARSTKHIEHRMN